MNVHLEQGQAIGFNRKGKLPLGFNKRRKRNDEKHFELFAACESGVIANHDSLRTP